MERRIKVCLILEGSYPFITGGVSSWMQDLIVNLPQIDFVLFTLSPAANQKINYKLPDNIIEHKDIVISDIKKSKTKLKNKGKIFKAIFDIHTKHLSRSKKEFTDLLKDLPENYYLYKDAVKTETGWAMIAEGHQTYNPIYPFADYFWAWKSSHDMLFTVLGTEPPEADIYHAISTGYAGLAAIAAKARKSKPFLLTEHGLYHKEREIEIRRTKFVRGYQRDMWIKVYNRLSILSYSYADKVTALFEDNRQIQIGLGARKDNTYVIPNGIDIERFTSIKREKREGFNIGLVGRVVPIKDIKTYIATAKIISEKIPEAVFYCIGPTDEDETYYEDCVKLVDTLKLSERFFFTGKQDVTEYYSFLDVLLLTSIREAQPLVILEGFCAGIPTVATRVGNVPELLNYNDNFIAPSKDSDKLAEGIMYIYQNPEIMEKINEENKKRVYQFYNKKDLHRKYHNIYKSLVN